MRAADKSPRAGGGASGAGHQSAGQPHPRQAARYACGRPLFERVAPAGRGAAAAAAASRAGGASPPACVDQNALSLLGVVASEGRTIALLKRNQTGQNVRAEVGDAVDGWTIVSIEPQRVVMRQGDTQIALQLFRRSPRRKAAQAHAPEHPVWSSKSRCDFRRAIRFEVVASGRTETTRAENVAGGASVPRRAGQRSPSAIRARRRDARIDASNEPARRKRNEAQRCRPRASPRISEPATRSPRP